MLNGKKSALKSHLSMKHPTHTHHMVAKAAHNTLADSERPMDNRPERNPSAEQPDTKDTANRQ
jgi:hypothetical protein